MIVRDVMAELGAALGTIDGLRVFEFGSRRISPPAALVGLPGRVNYSLTYGHGMVEFDTVPVLLLVGSVDARSSHAALSRYLDPSGPQSVRAAIEGHTYTSCDTVTVRSAEPDSYTIQGQELLSAAFAVHVAGNGV